MSLENKIEELTKAVNLLTQAILERDISELADNIAAPTKPIEPEVIKAEVAETKKAVKDKPKAKKESNDKVTAEDVQAVCMALVRKDTAKKAPIVALLNEYGAKTVGQVPAEKLAELKTKLEAL